MTKTSIAAFFLVVNLAVSLFAMFYGSVALHLVSVAFACIWAPIFGDSIGWHAHDAPGIPRIPRGDR